MVKGVKLHDTIQELLNQHIFGNLKVYTEVSS